MISIGSFTYKSLFYVGIFQLGDGLSSRASRIKDFAAQAFSNFKSNFYEWIGRKTEKAVSPKIEKVTAVIEKHSDGLPKAVRNGAITGSLTGGAATLTAAALAGASAGSFGGTCLGLGGAVIGGAIGGVMGASNYIKQSDLKQDFKGTGFGNLPPVAKVVKREILRSESISDVASACSETLGSMQNSALMGMAMGAATVVATSALAAVV